MKLEKLRFISRYQKSTQMPAEIRFSGVHSPCKWGYLLGNVLAAIESESSMDLCPHIDQSLLDLVPRVNNV